MRHGQVVWAKSNKTSPFWPSIALDPNSDALPKHVKEFGTKAQFLTRCIVRYLANGKYGFVPFSTIQKFGVDNQNHENLKKQKVINKLGLSFEMAIQLGEKHLIEYKRKCSSSDNFETNDDAR